MKKILFIIIICIFVYFIYNGITDRNIKYLYIGSNDYNRYNILIKDNYIMKEYTTYIRDDDYRVMDLINDIVDNRKINNRKFQNLLVKSNIIVISTGINDLEYKEKLNYNYVDELINDIEKLLKLIRKYNKDTIYVLGYYDKNEYYKYTNKRLKEICKTNNVKYIDIEKSISKQLY